ncbi:protein SIEVE ELEMENT OCCLUSION A-like [Carex rostrata]
MLVALDERGRVARQNALLMLDLYGDEAFPFTTVHENELLAKKSRGMQLVLPDTDAKLSQWKKSKEQYVCLYGGDDLKWCKELDEKLQMFTKKGNIKVEKAYVGWNSHHKEEVEEKLTSFKGAELGHYMDHSTSTEFWKRLKNFVLHFSTQDSSDVSKNFLSWAAPLLIFDESRDTDTWVAIGNADNVLAFRGSVFLSGLNIILGKFKKWESNVTTDNFLTELRKWLDDLNKEQVNKNHCHKFEIAGSPALIKGDMHCPTCEKLMQLTMVYKCCTTEN